MKLRYRLLIILVLIILSFSFQNSFQETEDSFSENRLYYGPVPEGCDEQYFRDNGFLEVGCYG